MEDTIIKCCGCQRIKPLAAHRDKEAYGRTVTQEYCQGCANRLGLPLDLPKEPKEVVSLEKQAAQQLFDQGLSLRQISTEMGAKWDRVRRLLRDYPPYIAYQQSGCQRRTNWITVEPQLILDLYQIGFSAYQLEPLLEIAAGTVRSRLREAGVQIRDRHQRLSPSPVDLLRVLNKHQWEVPEPLKKLAKEWGLSPSEDSPVVAVQQRRAG